MSKMTVIVDDDDYASELRSPYSSHGFLKFLCVLLFAVFAAGLFVPRYFNLSPFGLATGSFAAKDQTVFSLVFENLKTIFSDKLGASQAFTLMSGHKTAWFLAACAVVLLVTTIITLCCRKSAGGWFGIHCGVMIIVGLPYAYMCLLRETKCIDLFLVACTLALVFLLIAAFARGKGKNVLPVICFIALSALMVLTCMYNFFPRQNASLYKNSTSLFTESARVYFRIFKNLVTGKSSSILLYENMAYIMFGTLLVCWILTVFQLGTVKKTTWFTVIRYLALCGVAVASFVFVLMSDALWVQNDVWGYIKEYPWYLVVIAVAFILFLLCLIAKISAKKKTKRQKVAKEKAKEEERSRMQAPGYAAPVYNAPVYGAPTYGAPVYGAPTYGAPIYGAPVYGNQNQGRNEKTAEPAEQVEQDTEKEKNN